VFERSDGDDGQRTGGQKPLFYSFKLDDHVPADHLLRGLIVALTWAS